MNAGRDPDDVDARFAAIVADLRAQGVGRFDEDPPDEQTERGADEPAPAEPGWRTGGTAWDHTMLGDDPDSDDEHYVPPEPPPLPRPGKGAFVVLLFFLIGLFMLIAPGLIGVSTTVGTPIGILCLAMAIALALLRVKQGPTDGDGAQV